jgi:hypothetical protein
LSLVDLSSLIINFASKARACLIGLGLNWKTLDRAVVPASTNTVAYFAHKSGYNIGHEHNAIKHFSVQLTLLSAKLECLVLKKTGLIYFNHKY